LKKLYSYLIFSCFFIVCCNQDIKEKTQSLSKEKEINFTKLEFSEIYQSSNDLILEKWNNYNELSEYINQFNLNDYSLLIDNKNYMVKFFTELKNTIPESINKPEIYSRLTVIETDFLKFESMISNFTVENVEKIKMVKKINNSFSNLNFQIDKLIEKQEITPL
jgi:hypothetical protein